jgi:hypothetical protein
LIPIHKEITILYSNPALGPFAINKKTTKLTTFQIY